MSEYPEDLPLLAIMLLVKRSRQVGVPEAELKRVFGDRLPFLLAELAERLKPLGLVAKYDPEDKKWFITVAPEYSDFVPAYLVSKTHAAVLATVLLLKARSNEVRVSDVISFLEGKVPREYVMNCLSYLKNEGYIKIRGDLIEIGKRTRYEIDIDRFLENVVYIFSENSEREEERSSSR